MLRGDDVLELQRPPQRARLRRRARRRDLRGRRPRRRSGGSSATPGLPPMAYAGPPRSPRSAGFGSMAGDVADGPGARQRCAGRSAVSSSRKVYRGRRPRPRRLGEQVTRGAPRRPGRGRCSTPPATTIPCWPTAANQLRRRPLPRRCGRDRPGVPLRLLRGRASSAREARSRPWPTPSPTSSPAGCSRGTSPSRGRPTPPARDPYGRGRVRRRSRR